MGSYNFDGTDDSVICSIGAVDWTMPVSVAYAVKFDTLGSNWRGGLTAYLASNPSSVFLSAETDPNLDLNWSAFGEQAVLAATVVINTWYIIGFNQPTSNSLTGARGHLLTEGSGWTHGALTGSGPIQESTLDRVILGCFPPDIDDLDGQILAAAWWGSSLSDAEFEELTLSSFGDWRDHSVAPLACWKLKYEDGNLVDVTGGGSDELSRTGITSGAEPTGWDWAEVTLQTIRPDADVADGGWGSTPLYSKLNDESDGTVVTDALA